MVVPKMTPEDEEIYEQMKRLKLGWIFQPHAELDAIINREPEGKIRSPLEGITPYTGGAPLKPLKSDP